MSLLHGQRQSKPHQRAVNMVMLFASFHVFLTDYATLKDNEFKEGIGNGKVEFINLGRRGPQCTASNALQHTKL